MRQLRRLNSANKSPIFSHFGESLSGLVTIRSFDRTRRFVQEMEAKIDNSSLFYYPDAVSYRYFLFHSQPAPLRLAHTFSRPDG